MVVQLTPSPSTVVATSAGRRAPTAYSDEDDEMLKPLPAVPENRGPPTIPLATLIEFAVQKVYHELTILSELLPKKMDADRKISIVQFAHSTRLLFIKLLALVKWVKTAKKVDACTAICYFLDQQAAYFIETADKLVSLARDELIHVRVPAFQIASAVDVLTLGQYPRLPLCLKSRFVPDPPITDRERACVLNRLNQIIQYRISSIAKTFSPRIKDVIIRNGMVTLVVPGEFQVSLTLLGELPSTQWTLLDVKILVEDYLIGYGTSLVHPIQLNYMHQVVQSRMSAAAQPLSELYRVLHAFAQSLQLDLLYCQAADLIAKYVRANIAIEKYERARELTIGYWPQQRSKRTNTTVRPTATTTSDPSSYTYKIVISIDVDNRDLGLRVRHISDCDALPGLDDRSGRLSIERLLSETVAVRCRHVLLKIRDQLHRAVGIRPALTGDAIPAITCALIDGAGHDDELLVVSVNMFSGRVKCRISIVDDCNEIRHLEKAFNDGTTISSISNIIERLRILLMVERCKKSIASLPVRLVPESRLVSPLDKLKCIAIDRLCLQFVRAEHYFLIVSFLPDVAYGVRVDFYLLAENDRRANVLHLCSSQMMQHFSFADLSSVDRVNDDGPPAKKRTRWMGNIVELTTAISTIDNRLAFIQVSEELDKRQIKHRPIETEPFVGGLMIAITSFADAIPPTGDDFFDTLTSCCLRLDMGCMRMDVRSPTIVWPFECTFIDPPLIGEDAFDGSLAIRSRTCVLEMVPGGYQYPTTFDCVTAMIERVLTYSKLYAPVKRFARAFENGLKQHVKICTFTYFKLVLAYGPDKSLLLTLSWRTQDSRYHLGFGQLKSDNCVWNPHSMMAPMLGQLFNKSCDLVHLVQLLIDTAPPLLALHRFVRTRFASIKSPSPSSDSPTSTNSTNSTALTLHTALLPVSPTLVRLVYGQLEMEFLLLAQGKIGVRDCARTPMCAGFDVFWKKYTTESMTIQVQPTTVMDEKPTLSDDAKVFSPDGVQLTSPATPAMTALTPATPKVMSIDREMIDNTTTISYPNSVKTNTAAGGSIGVGAEMLRTSRNAIIVDHAAIDSVTRWSADRCPLDDYLSALCYLNKIGASLNAYQREMRSNVGREPLLRNLQLSPDSIAFQVLGATVSGVHGEPPPWKVTFHIYLDAEAMALRIKLHFAGSMLPTDADIAIAEQYFLDHIYPMNSEVAVISFINACRLSMHGGGAFAAVVRIMQSQMEDDTSAPWRISLQMVSSTPKEGKRHTNGLQLDAKCQQVLICIRLRASTSNNDHQIESHAIPLIYHTTTNTVQVCGSAVDHQLSTADSHPASGILQTQSEIAQRTNECCIYPAIRHLINEFNPLHHSMMR